MNIPAKYRHIPSLHPTLERLYLIQSRINQEFRNTPTNTEEGRIIRRMLAWSHDFAGRLITAATNAIKHDRVSCNINIPPNMFLGSPLEKHLLEAIDSGHIKSMEKTNGKQLTITWDPEPQTQSIKTARFEMRIAPDKLAQYKERASKEGVSLSSWLEKLADNELAGAYDE